MEEFPVERTSARRADFETGLGRDEKLELRLWLRLLTCTTLIERQVRARLRQEFSTTLPRFDALAQLDRAADGLTMGQLSDRLMVSAGNITGLIDRLVREGLVKRTPNQNDRRTQRVSLTTRGKAEFDAMTPQHKAWIETMLGDMDEQNMNELIVLLGKLKKAVEKGAS